MSFRIRAGLLGAVFGVQAAAIVYARFVSTRFLAWAPYDQISFYRIEAQVRGRTLAPPEIAARYRMPAEGRENRSIHHVLSAIAQYERTYGRHNPAAVRVIFRVNGGSELEWSIRD